MATCTMTTASAQQMKIEILAAGLAGDDSALLILADWCEDNGAGKAARAFRLDHERYSNEEGATMRGETWLQWRCRYELEKMAEPLVASEMAFARYDSLGSSSRDREGTFTLASEGGYVPTLCRSKPKQARLGRILEALGHKVHFAK
jgi:hypothetical protein